MFGPLEAEVSYDGVVHRRRIEIGGDVVVSDEVRGGGNVEARLPLAHALEVPADAWETGSEARGFGSRREVPVAVRTGRAGEWRIRRAATL